MMDKNIVEDFFTRAKVADVAWDTIKAALKRDEMFMLGDEWGEQRKKWLEKQKSKEGSIDGPADDDKGAKEVSQEDGSPGEEAS